jgi:hypothetical protein
MIHVFIKGHSDFGKKKINATESNFAQFNTNSQVSDIHIYYYPNTPSMGVYKVIEVDNSGNYSEGKMKNLMGEKDIFSFLNFLRLEGLVDFAENIEKIVYHLQSTYNPELLIEAKN